MFCKNCQADIHGDCSNGPHDPVCSCLICVVEKAIAMRQHLHVKLSSHQPVISGQGELDLTHLESPLQLWFPFISVNRGGISVFRDGPKIPGAKWWVGQTKRRW